MFMETHKFHVYFQKHDMPDSIKQRYGEYTLEELIDVISYLCDKKGNQPGDKIVIEIIKDTNIQ